MTGSPAARLARIRARIEASPMGRRLVGGAFWSFSGALAQRGAMMLSLVVAARILGTEKFGELGVIRNTTIMFTTVAGIGLGLTAMKHVAELRESDPQRAGRILGMSASLALVAGGGLGLGLFVFAGWFASTVLAAPHLEGLLRIGSLMLLFSAMVAAQRGALAGFEEFRIRSKVDLVSGLVTIPLVAGGVWLDGLRGAVIGIVTAQAITWLVSHAVLRIVAKRHSVPLTLRGSLSELGVLWRFSLPATLNSSMISPVNWLCAVILVNEPGGYQQMGLFGAANQYLIVLTLFPILLGHVVLPMLSNLRGQGQWQLYRKLFRTALAVNSGVLVTVAVPLVLLAGPLMRIYGAEFEAGRPALIALVLASVLMAPTHVLSHSLISHGRVWLDLVLNSVWAAVLLSLTWTLRDEGAYGLAMAMLAAYGTKFVLAVLVVWVVSRGTGRATEP